MNLCLSKPEKHGGVEFPSQQQTTSVIDRCQATELNFRRRLVDYDARHDVVDVRLLSPFAHAEQRDQGPTFPKFIEGV